VDNCQPVDGESCWLGGIGGWAVAVSSEIYRAVVPGYSYKREIKRPLPCSKVAAFYCWYFNFIAAHQQNQRTGGVREIGWNTFRFDNLNLIFIRSCFIKVK
jgi:hypothetical protein